MPSGPYVSGKYQQAAQRGSVKEFFGPRGLVRYNPFWDNSLDRSGSGVTALTQTGTLNLVATPPGFCGNRGGSTFAYPGSNTSYFTGSDTAGVISRNTTYTFMVWVWLDPSLAGTAQCLYSERDSSNNTYTMDLGYEIGAGTTYSFEFSTVTSSGTSNANANATITAQTGRWYHLAAVQRSTSLRELYVDGVLVATDTFAHASMLTRNTCTLGQLYYGASSRLRPFKGYIREFASFNTDLSSTGISEYVKWSTTPIPTIGFFQNFGINTKISESLTISDTLTRGLNPLTTTIQESLTINDTTDGHNTVQHISQAESLTIGDTLTSQKSTNRQLSESLTINDSLSYLISISIRQQLFHELEPNRILSGVFPLSHNLSGNIFMIKNFFGTGARLAHSIYGSVTNRFPLKHTLSTGESLTISKSLFNSLLPDSGVVSRHSTEYKVLLDGLDVTSKVASCTINYARDSFTADVDIVWADPVKSELYHQVDCSNIEKNFQIERLEVWTRIKTNAVPTWYLQGKFFLEKRSTTVLYNSIVPSSWGRNRPAVLSLPYAKPITKTWTTDTTARAIAEELCSTAPLPVTLSWEVADYIVLGSNVSADGEEPINIISTLAATVGGILTCSKSGVLRVIYRYSMDTEVVAPSPSIPAVPMIDNITIGDTQATVYFH